MHTLRLKNAVFYAHHGTRQEEQRTGGRYEVDVCMDLDFSAAAEADDLARTVDYERVYSVVQDAVLNNRFSLIERLAYLIAQKILRVYPIVVQIEVTVRKTNPPIGGPSDCAEAVYRSEKRSP